MVDDQFETYTTELLRSIKENHERWVDSKFAETKDLPPIRVRRFKSEIPALLELIESGQDLLNIASGCHGSYQNYSDDLSSEEVETVGAFLQSLKDWGDISDDLEPIERARAMKFLGDELGELKSQGFLVFAAREKQRIEGGIGSPSDFMVLHVSVVRDKDANIIRPAAQ